MSYSANEIQRQFDTSLANLEAGSRELHTGNEEDYEEWMQLLYEFGLASSASISQIKLETGMLSAAIQTVK